MNNPNTVMAVRRQIERQVAERRRKAAEVIEIDAKLEGAERRARSARQAKMRKVIEHSRRQSDTGRFIRRHINSDRFTIEFIKARVLWFNREILGNEMTLSDLTGPGRTIHFVFARKQVSYWARELTGRSYPEIGRRLGGRDHTTILHGHLTYESSKAKAKRKKAAKRK